MSEAADYPPPTHLDAIREAWWEFKESVRFEFYGLHESDLPGDLGLPAPIAWVLAPWKPLRQRFSSYNLERLFRPQKAERRQRLDDLSQYVFVCGASEWGEERWTEVEALLAEFGGVFPPRDWEPMSVAETVGTIMGMSREEVAEIVERKP
jgi:hypothetical protein